MTFSFTYTYGPTREYMVTANEDANALLTLWHVIYPSSSGESVPHLYITVGPSEEARLDVFDRHIALPDDATIRDLLDALDGEALALNGGGWGGDVLWVESILNLWELTEFVMSVGGAIAFVRSTGKGLRKLRYREHSALASRWVDDGKPGEVPLALRQHVNAQNPWRRRHFNFVFGLEGPEGADLLRAVGYRVTRGHGDEAEWSDAAHPPQGKPYYDNI